MVLLRFRNIFKSAGVNLRVKRYHARKDLASKIKEDLKIISVEFAENLPDRIEILETGGKKFIHVNGESIAFESNGSYFPTVRGAFKIKGKKGTITVDRGAVSCVVNGADIMRPGVVFFDENIKLGDFVIIREETHSKTIAIGISLWNGEEFATRHSGKCVKNLHFVGDDIWKLG